MDERIKNLTLKEKVLLLSGYNRMYTYPIKDKNIPSITMSDGPNGLRREVLVEGSTGSIDKTLPATCFPTGVTITSTWNDELVEEMGKAISKECDKYHVDIVLGPAINIHRNPLCGRNFEYLSEDPILAGNISAHLIKGIQVNGAAACMKHFACNNNEKYRYNGDSIIDTRALHEIYLKPFEISTKLAHPKCVMTSYNKINGIHSSENEYILKDTLRSSWGFDGIVMTDWGGIHDRVLSLKASNDLEMPGMVDHNNKMVYNAVKKGDLDESILDESIDRLLKLSRNNYNDNVDISNNYDIALKIALEGAVLLKNDTNTLPLDKNKKHLIIGGLFEHMRYQGSGSSLINPIKVVDHIAAFNKYNINYDFILGYKENETEPNINLENECLEKIKEYDEIIFYGGLNDYVESEGFDRDNMFIPNNQISLINKLTKLNKKIIMILFGGSPFIIPEYDKIDSILLMQLPGEAGGEATTRLLFGLDNPSGKLVDTWPISYDDIPFSSEFTTSCNELYKESIFVGYRYFNTLNKITRFPFGYGLSYSKFKYNNLDINVDNTNLNLSVNISNISNISGKEIIEIYAEKLNSNIVRPKIELIGYKKVLLDSNEVKDVNISIPLENLKKYVNSGFRLEDGTYRIYVGSSSIDLILSKDIDINGEIFTPTIYDDIYNSYLKNNTLTESDYFKALGRTITPYIKGVRPYTMETPIGEFNTFFGRIFKNIAINRGYKQYKRGCKMKDSLEKEREKKNGIFVMKLMPCNTLRSLCYSSSGELTFNKAKAILELANNHPFVAIKELKKKERIE